MRAFYLLSIYYLQVLVFPSSCPAVTLNLLQKYFLSELGQYWLKGKDFQFLFPLTSDLEQKVHCVEFIRGIRTELLMILFQVTRPVVSHCCFIVHFLPTTNYQLPATIFQPSALVKGTKPLGVNSLNFQSIFLFF